MVMTERGDLTEIQASGEGTSFSRDDFNELLDLAGKGIEKLIKLQKEVLEI
ncbi:Ribonuclease PH [subsurface metagenome]